MRCLINIDMHLHTVYSGDGFIGINTLKKLAKKKKIIPIVTDHDTTKAYKKLKLPIMGEEIRTKQGEVIAYFLNEHVKKMQDIHETIDQIRAQGALVGVPHPFDFRRGSTLRYDLKKINVDMLEVFNARCLLKNANGLAYNYARKNGYLFSAGSDAHLPWEFGRTYIKMNEFDFESPKEFLKNLKTAEIVRKKSPLWVHILTAGINRIRRVLPL